jgi:hypothetical protein
VSVVALSLFALGALIASNVWAERGPWTSVPFFVSAAAAGVGLARVLSVESQRRVLVAQEFSEAVTSLTVMRDDHPRQFELDWPEIRRQLISTQPDISLVLRFSSTFQEVDDNTVEIRPADWHDVFLVAEWLYSHEMRQYVEQLRGLADHLHHQAREDRVNALRLARDFRAQGEYERADVLEQLLAATAYRERNR